MTKPDGPLEALDALVDDVRFLELGDYVPPLSLLRAIGRSQDELTHSRLIAALFNPRQHAAAPVALRKFFGAVIDRLRRRARDDGVSERLAAAAAGKCDNVVTHREREKIDVVIEIESSNPAVLGIENKIRAGEGPEQLARYQAALADRYGADRAKILVFLTPKGRPPQTHDSDSSVPCVPLAYEEIVDAAQAALKDPKSPGAPALKELIRHLNEEIMGNAEIEDRARQIWKEHSHALRLLHQHRPKLRDIRPTYVERLEGRFGDDAVLEFYPRNRADIDEIKFSLKSWAERGCEFIFMLHTQEYGDAKGRPRFRLFVRDRWYEQHEQTLKSLAERVNASEADLRIDESFTRLSGWSNWRRVLDEDLYPDEAVLNEVVIPRRTEDEAFKRLTSLVEILHPHVRALPMI